MLNYEFPPIGGGAGKAHLCILKEFSNHGDLEIDVLTSSPEPGFTQELLGENIMIYKVGVHKTNLHYWRKVEVIEWLLKASFCYRKLLKDNTYDLVHAFFGFPTGWLCYLTARELPYIISLRGSDVPGYNIRLGLDYKILAGLFRRIWTRASAIVANSEGLKQLALQFMPEIDIPVIPNGIDTAKFCPNKDKKLSQRVRVLTVCRLISRKRIDLLIEAVLQATKLGIDVEFNIAGEGNLKNQLERLAGKLNIGERVNFLGRVPSEEMPAVYRNNDIFIMSSAHEGMSNAMLEAMASGLPIITTRCEGVEELIADNGIVVDQACAEELAKAIGNLAGDRQRCEQMAVAARKQAEKFSWHFVAEEYLGCYHAIIQKTTNQPL